MSIKISNDGGILIYILFLESFCQVQFLNYKESFCSTFFTSLVLNLIKNHSLPLKTFSISPLIAFRFQIALNSKSSNTFLIVLSLLSFFNPNFFLRHFDFKLSREQFPTQASPSSRPKKKLARFLYCAVSRLF